ncbi:MAG: thiamine diphosphokinase [Clostridia bacterium]|nr:thiamine diphosphokinase [Clostridia bacterium]
MSKALIISSYGEHLNKIDFESLQYDHVICADAGYLVAKDLGLKPDTLIGDFDSMDAPDDLDAIVLPKEKDLTDSEAAFDWAVRHGFTAITMIGGLGGRFDHTMGNIGLLAKYTKAKINVNIIDGQNKVYMLRPGIHQIKKDGYKYLGLLSYDTATKGITLEGVKYPVKNEILSNDTTYGVSNEITKDEAKLSFTQGMLLVIQTKDI